MTDNNREGLGIEVDFRLPALELEDTLHRVLVEPQQVGNF
ncbi:hypothetical protein CDEF62S_00147 [Castellaniella defragrans]